MNREERIEKARQMAAQRAPRSGAIAEQHANRLHQRLSDVGASQAHRHVVAVEQSENPVYLDPIASPEEWEQTVQLVRVLVAKRAKRHDTITHGELKWAILDATRKLLAPEAFERLLAAVDEDEDQVLLSSIAVSEESGKPRPGFTAYAESRGFEFPVETLQRQVFERFG